MKYFYPNYYKNFKCIADKCPDSCCKDWDVVVDDKSQSFYETVGGEFGAKLKRLTAIDGDGDRIFVSKNGRCPFWNNEMLCDIYINLGKEHLCSTCKNFPRISQDYTYFTEYMLSFACPEAARLMLTHDEIFNFETSVTSDKKAGFDIGMMNFLLAARKITFDILNDLSVNFTERLRTCLAFNMKIQDIIDEEDFDIYKIPKIETSLAKSVKADSSFIFELHLKLDIMNQDWRNLLEETGKQARIQKISENFDREFTILSKYYIYRYYLTAIDSFDVISTIKRIVCAYTVIGHILSSDKKLTPKQRVLVMQRYSKEVEHSYENSEMLEKEFYCNPDFSGENLIRLL